MKLPEYLDSMSITGLHHPTPMTQPTPKQVIATALGVPVDALRDTAIIVNLDCVDSLDLVEAVIDLEEEFGILLDDADIHNQITVGALVSLVEEARRVRA